MKKISLLLFSLCFLSLTSLSSKVLETIEIEGPGQLNSVKATTLEITGPLEFHRLEIKEVANVTGSMKGEEGTFGQLYVTGEMDVDHVITDDLVVNGPVRATYLDVKKQATITGTFEVQHGKLKTLKVNADKILLNDVTVDTITIGENQNHPVLTLDGNTVVSGDIVFEVSSGSVQVNSPDVKIKGSVKGGEIIGK